MRCIGMWSETEASLGDLLSVILRLERGSAFAAVQMYLRLNSADARRSVLDAAAKAMLKAEDYELFVLTMKAIKPIRDRRNDFAHGVWGFAAELDDALLWASADDHILYDAILSGAHPLHPSSPAAGTILGAAVDATDELYRATMVYRVPDLDGDLRRAEDASAAVNCLKYALHPYEKKPDAMRRELLASPLLQKASENPGTPKSIPEAQP